LQMFKGSDCLLSVLHASRSAEGVLTPCLLTSCNAGRCQISWKELIRVFTVFTVSIVLRVIIFLGHQIECQNLACD
jgi:hypothetical protein